MCSIQLLLIFEMCKQWSLNINKNHIPFQPYSVVSMKGKSWVQSSVAEHDAGFPSTQLSYGSILSRSVEDLLAPKNGFPREEFDIAVVDDNKFCVISPIVHGELVADVDVIIRYKRSCPRSLSGPRRSNHAERLWSLYSHLGLVEQLPKAKRSR